MIHMIENKHNNDINKVYQQMLLNESNGSSLIKKIDKWSKNYLNSTNDKKKVKNALDKIKSIIQSPDKNLDKIESITDEFISISNSIKDDENGSKIKNELADILDEI